MAMWMAVNHLIGVRFLVSELIGIGLKVTSRLMPMIHEMTGRRRWTDDDLRSAVERSQNKTEVLQHLGLLGSGNWTIVKRHIDRLRLNCDHFTGRIYLVKRSIIDDDLRIAVQESVTVAEVAKKLGLKSMGRDWRRVQERIETLQLDCSHFQPRTWSNKKKANSYLFEGSSIHSRDLKRLLLQENILEAECSQCHIREWHGSTEILQLDHINGQRHDNRLENLRILCANCHCLTETWGNKRGGRVYEEGTRGC